MPTKIMIDCPHCRGVGKIPHNCHPGDCLVVKKIWSRENTSTHSSESLTIRKCKICGQLYKVRHQWDDGTGSDDIWLMPGESRRGYEFTLEEAAEFEGEGSGSESVQPTLFAKEEIESCGQAIK